jgi:hypothetical protein
MVLRVVPIEEGVDVGCGEVFEAVAEEFHGYIPEDFAAGVAKDCFHFSAKAQAAEVYDVLA